jgi:hypothetical protein
MRSICVSARITDSATIQILALAHRNQIRNVNTRLFVESGKPRSAGKGERLVARHQSRDEARRGFDWR